MVKLLARLAAVLFISTVLVKTADACPCGLELSDEESYFIVKITGECPSGPEISVEEAYLKADGVFVGKMVASRPSEFNINGHRYLYVDYVFEVVKKYKGRVINNRVVFRTGVGGSDCGYRFSAGEEYLIYGNRYKDNLYSTNTCTRNRKIESCEKEELIRLDQMAK